MVNKILKTNPNTNKNENPRFKDKNTENFYHSERVRQFQELSRSDKQSAHRKVGLIYQAKNWNEITLYFPPGTSGSRLEKIGKDQYSILLSKKYRLIFRWDKEKKQAYDVWIDPHSKKYGK